jgi:hypothetical protein
MMLIVQPQSQAPKVLKHFILAFQEENLRVTRIVIITVLTREWEAAIILP